MNEIEFKTFQVGNPVDNIEDLTNLMDFLVYQNKVVYDSNSKDNNPTPRLISLLKMVFRRQYSTKEEKRPKIEYFIVSDHQKEWYDIINGSTFSGYIYRRGPEVPVYRIDTVSMFKSRKGVLAPGDKNIVIALNANDKPLLGTY